MSSALHVAQASRQGRNTKLNPDADATKDVNEAQGKSDEAPLDETRRRFLTPAADVFESDQGWMVLLDLPGVGKQDVDLSVDQNILTIRAERGEDSGYFRSFGLPKEVDVAKVSAKHVAGVLTVTLPKATLTPPQKIAVK